jgi:hypothetical protein
MKLLSGRKLRAAATLVVTIGTCGFEIAAKANPTASAGTEQSATCALTVTDAMAVMQFQDAPNATYILQARNALDTGEWFNITANRTDDSGAGTFGDPGVKDSPNRFYRVATP